MRSFKALACAVSFATAALVAAGSDVVMKPLDGRSGAAPVAFVMLQGAQIPADRYVELGNAIQKASDQAVWFAVPELSLSTPEPLVVDGGIKRAVQSLQAAGMPETTPIVVGGHSLGGAMVQDWTAKHASELAGQVLMGAFLTRKQRGSDYPVPTLAMAGTLDGLCRVTRMAEEIDVRVNGGQGESYPVVLLRGVSHMQYATGEPPLLVKKSDLKPEVSDDDARAQIATVVADFLSLRTGGSDAAGRMQSRVQDSATFAAPLIAGMHMEESLHLKPPCCPFDKTAVPLFAKPCAPFTDSCSKATAWSQKAQAMMADMPESNVAAVDTIHPVWAVNPVHLPQITANCTRGLRGCTVGATTVTQQVYSNLDSLDTGFYPTAADELRVKMNSRQRMQIAAGNADAQFNQTDETSICATINQAAYDLALSTADDHTAQRFRSMGEALVMGDDLGPYNAGPLWIWDALKMDKGTDAAGNTVTVVKSPMMRTPTDYSVKAAAGFHYCKLLSPFRALEWVYVDGLRLRGSIADSAVLDLALMQ